LACNIEDGLSFDAEDCRNSLILKGMMILMIYQFVILSKKYSHQENPGSE